MVDFGANCTAPDYHGGDFRGLPVYSLIGIWSKSDSNIDPVIDPIDAPFYVGSWLDVWVPDNGVDPLYLFLATNDGDFDDNTCDSYTTNPCDDDGDPYIEQTYQVKISEVPVPAAFWLFLSGLALVRKFRSL